MIFGKAGFPPDALPPELERQPSAGFVGRDETLLALDRALDTERVVLLRGCAGSGKTATAAEFARYWHSGSGASSVFFSSFERHTSLSEILEAVGPADDRIDVTLQRMSEKPVLWIWDSVEPVAGFGAKAWSPAE